MRCRQAPFALPASIEADLVARYGEPHRAYHDGTHIAEVLGWFDIVADAGLWQRPREVYAAIVFHDAIYQPGAKDNEARSADLLRAANLPIDADFAAELVLLTARHGSLDGIADPDTAHFLDSDMAIVGAEPAAFDRYDAAIRREYAAVPEAAYRAGRRAFLQSVLAKSRIFFSELFHTRLDARARANLERAIVRLV